MYMVGSSENSFWGIFKNFYFAALISMWSLGNEEMTERQAKISASLKGADLRFSNSVAAFVDEISQDEAQSRRKTKASIL